MLLHPKNQGTRRIRRRKRCAEVLGGEGDPAEDLEALLRDLERRSGGDAFVIETVRAASGAALVERGGRGGRDLPGPGALDLDHQSASRWRRPGSSRSSVRTGAAGHSRRERSSGRRRADRFGGREGRRDPVPHEADASNAERGHSGRAPRAVASDAASVGPSVGLRETVMEGSPVRASTSTGASPAEAAVSAIASTRSASVTAAFSPTTTALRRGVVDGSDGCEARPGSARDRRATEPAATWRPRRDVPGRTRCP